MDNNRKPFSFKLNVSLESDNAIASFLTISAEHGLNKSFIIKLALRRLIADVSNGLLPNIGFPTQFISSEISEKQTNTIAKEDKENSVNWEDLGPLEDLAL